jgi:hypothetical protein
VASGRQSFGLCPVKVNDQQNIGVVQGISGKYTDTPRLNHATRGGGAVCLQAVVNSGKNGLVVGNQARAQRHKLQGKG